MKKLLILILLAGFGGMVFSQGLINNNAYIRSSSGSYWKFCGSASQNIKSTTPDRTTFHHMVVDFTAADYYLTLKSDSYLTVAGDLTLNDSLVLESTSLDYTASLLTQGSISGSKAIAQRFFKVTGTNNAKRYHIFSSPISDGTTRPLYWWYAYYYNESLGEYKYFNATEPYDALKVGQGFYTFPHDVNNTYGDMKSFRGTLNTGSIAWNGSGSNYTVSYTSGKGNGYNLVGNPYPGTIDWKASSGWTTDVIDATIYYYVGDPDKSGYLQLATYNKTTDASTNGGTRYIPAMQGFWIHASSTPTFAMNNNVRVHQAATYWKDEEMVQNLLRLKVSNGAFGDESVVMFYPGATSAFDPDFDAYKMKSYAEEVPSFYSLLDDETETAVNCLGSETTSAHIPFRFEYAANGTFTLTASGFESFVNESSFALEDLKMQQIIDLKAQPVYQFTYTEGDNPLRFKLHINGTFGIQEGNVKPVVSVSYDDGKLLVFGLDESDYQADIYDLSGRKCGTYLLKAGDPVIRTGTLLNSSVYLINLSSRDHHYSSKIFIK